MNTIVIGPNHNNTLGLIWSLGEAGHIITLLLYKADNNYVSKSKYVSKVIFIDHDDDIVKLIKQISADFDKKPAVFVSNDKDATVLNDHASELMPYCYFEGNHFGGNINIYRNKDYGNQLARECGLNTPKNIAIDAPGQLNEISLNYPIVIKANNSVHGGKLAMKRCNSEQMAFDFINNLPEDYFPLQVQEYIEKEYEIMLLGCSLNGGDKLICPIANKKIRHYPHPMGLGSYSESVEVRLNEDLKSLASKVACYMRAIRYTGLFSAEFLYSKGVYYFLEINLRNDGTSWLSTCSGYNLPDMLCRSYLGEEVSADDGQFKKMYYMNIMADIHYARKEVGIINWIKLFNKGTCYSHYNKQDRKPFWHYMKEIVMGHLK